MKQKNLTSSPKRQKRFVANFALLLLGGAMSTSGLILQCHYHLQKALNESTVWTLNRTEWNTFHVWTSIGFSFMAFDHVWAHRKWYQGVVKKKLLSKHRNTILCTFLLFMVLVSGLFPFLFALFNDHSAWRFSIIEIHDKISILFLIIVFLHTVKRAKWYLNAIKAKF